MPPPDQATMTPEERRLAIDERKLAIEERRIKLDESFAKKWGSYVLPVMATVCTTIIGAAVTLSTNHIASIQKQIENNRAALDLYFKVFPKKEMGLDKDAESKVSAIEFDMLEKITMESDLRGSLGKIREFVATSKRAAASDEVNSDASKNSPDAAQRELVNAVAGVRDVTPVPSNGQYQAADFLAYPQAPIGADDAKVNRVLDTLAAQGFKVQRTQRMKPGVSPSQSEVRYYRPEHKELAQAAADKLNQALNTHFVIKPINIGKTLPNGIMEFWLGDKNP